MLTELVLIPAPFNYWKGYCHLIPSDLIIIQFFVVFFHFFPLLQYTNLLTFYLQYNISLVPGGAWVRGSTISLTAGAYEHHNLLAVIKQWEETGNLANHRPCVYVALFYNHWLDNDSATEVARWLH